MPPSRLRLDSYFDPDPKAPDKTYSTRAAVIDGFSFDGLLRRIPRSTVEATDIAHWLALEVALQAIEDAAVDLSALPRERTAVVVGNTLTGEQSRAATMRPRWPFVERCVRAAAETKRLAPGMTNELLETAETYFKSVFAPYDEDTLAGSLSNTIAGRICNFLDLHGGGYVVDGACASSLLAVITAANALRDGDVDLAIAGGVDVSLDTMELVGFAKAGALSASEMRVYDRAANGFLPGEGCGFVLLKRWADAIADGNRIYAAVRGWGISSDGKGGITAPSRDGQALALRRAYERAGYSPHTLHFVEGHGTGTRLGDKIELEGIATAMAAFGDCAPRSCGVTSFKSIVGHTKAAAGIGGFIKAVMGVNRRVVPPTAGCSEPRETFDERAQSIYPVLLGQVHEPSAALRAGVSAMGFGGINSHVTLESAGPPDPRLTPSLEERALMVSHQDTELFLLSASSQTHLVERIATAEAQARGMSVGELVDLSARWLDEVSPEAPYRLAIVAEQPEELERTLGEIKRQLASHVLSPGVVERSGGRAAWVGCAAQEPRLGLVFPGQGSQLLNMGRSLVERFAWARELAARADEWLAEVGAPPMAQRMFRPVDRARDDREIGQWQEELRDTSVAQPAICLASLLWYRRLRDLGLSPTVVAGHSLGELTAFCAAGAISEKQLLQLAALRGRAMAEADTGGSMVSLRCDAVQAAALAAAVSGELTLANRNSPRQTVLSGPRAHIDEVAARAKAAGVAATVLPVSSAFHSPMMKPAAELIRRAPVVPPHAAAFTATLLSGTPQACVGPEMDLREHFSHQVCRPVDYVSVAEELRRRCDVVLEVGPGRVLSGLLQDGDPSHRPLSGAVEPVAGQARGCNEAMAMLFAHGAQLRLPGVHEGRLVRPFTPARDKLFIDNPCERPLSAVAVPKALEAASNSSFAASALRLVEGLGLPPNEAERYVLQRGEFLHELLRLDIKSLKTPDAPEREATAAPRDTEAAPQSALPQRLDVPTVSSPPPQEQTTAPGGDPSAEILQTLLELVTSITGFPLASLSPDLRLLEDLNIDSIKATELVGKAARRWNIAGQLDPATFANATLADIASAMAAHVAAPDHPVAPPAPHGPTRSDAPPTRRPPHLPPLSDLDGRVSNYPTWIRNFELQLEVAPLAVEEPLAEVWRGITLTILHDASNEGLVTSIAQELRARGVSCRSLRSDGPLGPIELRTAAPREVILCLLSRSTVAASNTRPAITARQASANIAHAATQLRAFVQSVPKGTPPTGARSFVVQFEPDSPYASLVAADAFVASLHLERPTVPLTSLTAPADLPPEELVEILSRELRATDTFVAARYDQLGVRSVPRPQVQQPTRYQPRRLELGASDVLLVTGGAKGITAACALALAEATGAPTVLVGSSPPSAPDVGATLHRFETKGLRCHYRQCDLVDGAQVAQLVGDVRRDFGPIGGVLHGAGLNRPRRVEEVSTEQAMAEVAPKLLGAWNLFEALGDSPPKLFIALTSIIGITGMKGNAWYAFANESLDRALGAYGKRHPSVQTVCTAFSVWEEIGMGARLGSVEMLQRSGIGAIPVEEGVKRFVELALRDPGVRQVAVVGRLTGLDTWRPRGPAVPSTGRFVENLVGLEPGVELVCRPRLTLERDPYLRDHLFRGSHLFPTVFGLEAMAQATAQVLGWSTLPPLTIRNIQLTRPVVVDPAEGCQLELRAVVLDADSPPTTRVRVSVRSEQTGFSQDHFSAEFVFGQTHRTTEPVPLQDGLLSLVPGEHLYGPLLFQGPRFQRIVAVRGLDSTTCTFEALRRRDADEFLLGDPYFRDAMLQSAQLCLTPTIALPIGISEWTIRSFPQRPREVLGCRLTVMSTAETGARSRVVAVADDGTPVEVAEGYDLHFLGTQPGGPTAAELATTCRPPWMSVDTLRRVLSCQAKDFGVSLPLVDLAFSPEIHARDAHERHRRQLPHFSALLRELTSPTFPTAADELAVRWTPAGQPYVDGHPRLGISASHDGDYCLYVASFGRQGCDISPVVPRSSEEWRILLGAEAAPLWQELCSLGYEHDAAGALLWAAGEAAKKAFSLPLGELTLCRFGPTAVMLIARNFGSHQMVMSTVVDWNAAGDAKRAVAVTVLPVLSKPLLPRSYEPAFWIGESSFLAPIANGL